MSIQDIKHLTDQVEKAFTPEERLKQIQKLELALHAERVNLKRGSAPNQQIITLISGFIPLIDFNQPLEAISTDLKTAIEATVRLTLPGREARAEIKVNPDRTVDFVVRHREKGATAFGEIKGRITDV